MIRRYLVVGILIASIHSSSARAETAMTDSTNADSTVHGWMAPAVWHPTRADTLMFQSVSRRVKPDGKARVYSRHGQIEVPGQAMSLVGVRLFERPDSTLPWADVTKVQSRHSVAGKGALAGGILFGVAGLIGMSAATQDCEGMGFTPCGASGGDVVAGTVGAFAIGSLLGALVTAPFHQWSDVPLDREVRSPGEATFNDLRRGFTLELAGGPSLVAQSNTVFPSNENSDVGVSTRFRLGHGFSERWTLAYVNDVSFYHGFTGITGLGVSRFTSPRAPSVTLELVGGIATKQDAGQAQWNPGIQAGLGFEFSRHWLLRASILHASFDSGDWNVVGTSIGRLWY